MSGSDNATNFILLQQINYIESTNYIDQIIKNCALSKIWFF